MSDVYSDKMRIIQEIVPGRQISLAHIIANPDESIYHKLGMSEAVENNRNSIGIITLSPAETTIIAADVAVKTSGVSVECIDRENGTLIFSGTVSQVEASVDALTEYCRTKLDFTVCDISRT